MWPMSKNGQKQSLKSNPCFLAVDFFLRLPPFFAAGLLEAVDFRADLRAGAFLRLDLELDLRAAMVIIYNNALAAITQ